MICPSRTPNQVLDASRRIAAELAAEASNPSADLTAADRKALVALSTAVEAEAVRVTGARDALADRLALIEAAAADPFLA